MNKLNMDKIKSAGKSILAFGKKNAPSIMTGGSIFLSWSALYFFWKESKKVNKAIEKIEKDRADNGEEPLTVKEKILLYLQYCWPSFLMELGATGLAIGANEINIERVTELYLLTQFLEGRNDDKDKLIDKLKSEIPEKKFNEIKEQLLEEEFPEETIGDGYIEDTGNGNTLFIVDFGGIKFRSTITDVQEGIMEFRDDLIEKRTYRIKSRLGDAFYASDNPYPDSYSDVYVEEDVDVFLKKIGVKQKINLGDILEIRYSGEKNFMSFSEIMDYKDYVDPVTGVPTVCFLRIRNLLRATNELIERESL